MALDRYDHVLVHHGALLRKSKTDWFTNPYYMV
jgi:hypothetical protein